MVKKPEVCEYSSISLRQFIEDELETSWKQLDSLVLYSCVPMFSKLLHTSNLELLIVCDQYTAHIILELGIWNAIFVHYILHVLHSASGQTKKKDFHGFGRLPDSSVPSFYDRLLRCSAVFHPANLSKAANSLDNKSMGRIRW